MADRIDRAVDNRAVEEGRDHCQRLEGLDDERGVDLIEVELMSEQRSQRAKIAFHLRRIAAPAEVADRRHGDADGGGEGSLDGDIRVEGMRNGRRQHGRGVQRRGGREEVRQGIGEEEHEPRECRKSGQDEERVGHRRSGLVGVVPGLLRDADRACEGHEHRPKRIESRQAGGQQ